MTPHKHAEVIKAWADGAQIQTKSATGEWIDFDNPSPSWAAAEYRVKPNHSARDMAIALAVRSAMLHAAYTIPGPDALDLAAIIATVKEP